MGNNDSASGWTSESNLDYANPNNGLKKQIFSLFKGTKTNTTYQETVTYIDNAFAIEGRDFVDGDSFDDISDNNNYNIITTNIVLDLIFCAT